MTHETPNLKAGAEAIAKSIMSERDFMTFGSGHSELICARGDVECKGLRVYYAPINNLSGGDVERLEGVAALIFAHYHLLGR